MRAKLVFLIAFCMVISCKKVEPPVVPTDNPKPTQPQEPAPTYVTSTTVGSQGGKLNDLSIDVDIPAGSFTLSKTVKLTKSTRSEIFGKHESSDFYKITGIPASFSKPIKVTITANSGSPDNLLMTVTEDMFVPSLQKVISTTQFISATKSGNKYTCDYEPFDTDINLPDSTLTLTFGLVKDYEEATSTKAPSKFIVHNPVGFRTEALQLRDHLDRIYGQLEGMNFSFSTRTKWPLKVNIKEFSGSQKSAYGYFVQSKWGHNYSSMEFNTTYMSDERELVATAGHELFHFAQSLYNPQGALSKMVKTDPFYWLDEASSVWFEEVAVQDPAFLPSVRRGHHMEPIAGIYKGPQTNAEHYGYGMSAFIKYLVKKNDITSLSKIYNSIKSGSAKDPVEAIENSHSLDFSKIYPKFLEEYFGGEIYSDFERSLLLSHATEGFHMASEDDTIKTITKEYEGFSARIFRVEVSYSGIKEADNLSIQSSAIGEFLVYKIKGLELSLLGRAYDEFIVPNLKKLKDENARILVIRPNSTNSKDEITVNFIVERGLGLDAVWAKLYVHGEFSGDIISSASVEFPKEVSSEDWPNYPMLKGSYNNETKVFSASYNGNSLVCNIDLKNSKMSGSISFSNNDATFTDRHVTANATFSNIPLVKWDDKYVSQYSSNTPTGTVTVSGCEYSTDTGSVSMVEPYTISLNIYFGSGSSTAK